MDEREETTHLDLSGLKCPLPALLTRKALRGLAPGGQITVVCTDPMAAIDIPNLVRESGDELVARDRTPTHLSFTIRKSATRETENGAVAENPHRPPH